MGHTTKDSKHNSETIEKVITELNNNTELTNNIKTEVINLQSKMAAGGASAITIDQVNNAPANADFQTSFNSHLKPDMLSSVGAEVGAQIDGDTVLKDTLKDKLDIDALETHVATKVSLTGVNDGSIPAPGSTLRTLWYDETTGNVFTKPSTDFEGKLSKTVNGVASPIDVPTGGGTPPWVEKTKDEFLALTAADNVLYVRIEGDVFLWQPSTTSYTIINQVVQGQVSADGYATHQQTFVYDVDKMLVFGKDSDFIYPMPATGQVFDGSFPISKIEVQYA